MKTEATGAVLKCHCPSMPQTCSIDRTMLCHQTKPSSASHHKLYQREAGDRSTELRWLRAGRLHGG
eukprot:366410-Chlamydomonas_euryale.AAC.33